MRFIFIFIVLCSSIYFVYGQHDSIQLPEVAIFSNWVKEKDPFTSTTISKSEINSKNIGLDVPYVLSQTPSLVETSDGGIGIGYTGLRIRGSDQTRINVTVNGVPINDAESQSVYWVDFPDILSSTEKIQIQRGVGSSTNGSGAFGGSIHLKTNGFEMQPQGVVALSGGSFNTYKTSFVAKSGRLPKNFFVDARLSIAGSDGYIDRAFSKLKGFSGSLGWLGKKQSLQYQIFGGNEKTYQAWNGVPYRFSFTEQTRTFNSAGSEKPDIAYDNEIDNYTQIHNHLIHLIDFNPNLNMNTTLHYNRGYGYYEQYKANQDLGKYIIDNLGISFSKNTDLIRQLWLDNHFYGIVNSIQYRQKGWALQTGISINQYQGKHFGKILKIIDIPTYKVFENNIYYSNDAIKTDIGIFVKSDIHISSKWNCYLDFQYRYLLYNFIGYNRQLVNVAQEQRYSFLNPKFGFNYTINKKSDYYLSMAFANREPNRDDFTQSTPDSRPKPENLMDIETGYRFKSDIFDFQGNIYWMYYKNQLVLTGRINDIGATIRNNVPDSRRVGVELVSGLKLSKKIHLNCNLNLSQNKIKSFDEYIDDWDSGNQIVVNHKNTDLSFSPNIIGNAELTFFPIITEKNTYKVSIILKYVDKQYIDNTSNQNSVLPSYTLVNMKIDWKSSNFLGKNSYIGVQLNNIFNELYSNNGWNYRFQAKMYDHESDPYSRFEGNSRRSLTGLFPQAPFNFIFFTRFEF